MWTPSVHLRSGGGQIRSIAVLVPGGYISTVGEQLRDVGFLKLPRHDLREKPPEGVEESISRRLLSSEASKAEGFSTNLVWWATYVSMSQLGTLYKKSPSRIGSQPLIADCDLARLAENLPNPMPPNPDKRWGCLQMCFNVQKAAAEPNINPCISGPST